MRLLLNPLSQKFQSDMKSSRETEYYPEADRPIRSITVASAPGTYSRSNRRISGSDTIRHLYPWLLFASTALAAAFCYAYITKPVVVRKSDPIALPTSTSSDPVSTTPETSILPDSSALPGDHPASQKISQLTDIPSTPSSKGYEETNLRMQHILDAESSSGDIHRMVIDVPVLYKSRNLRWSQHETAQARNLLKQLEQHQEQIRALRDQGKLLLHDWNVLMNASIPEQALRADSPSLPINQRNNKISTPVPASNGVILNKDKK